MQELTNKRSEDGEQKKKTYFLDSYAYRESDSAHRERNVPGTVVHNWKSDDDFWYATAEIKQAKKRAATPVNQDLPFFQQTWFQTLIWLIIIGAFAGVLIWYLAESKVGIFRRKNQSIVVRRSRKRMRIFSPSIIRKKSTPQCASKITVLLSA